MKHFKPFIAEELRLLRKRKEMNIVIIIILGIFCTLACVQVVEIPPNNLPKYAVVSTVSPADTLLSAFVSKVIPVGDNFNSEELIPQNAIVKISGEGKAIELKYNSTSKRYESREKGFINFGKKYELSVSIPQAVNLKAITEILPKRHFDLETETKQDTLYLTAKWTKNKQTESYTGISAFYAGKTPNTFQYVSWGRYTETDTGIEAFGKLALANIAKPNILTVRWTEMDIVARTYFLKRSQQYNQNESLQQSMLAFAVGASANGANLNSFFERFKDPVLLPTNVQNGLGYFGSYIVDEQKVVLK
jgi:Domain of unknown function (DUF4249)